MLPFVLPAESPGEPTCRDLIIGGRSVEQWRAVIRDLDPRDPANSPFVPGLIELMDDGRTPWITRRQAALTLGRMGPLARDAIPSLTKRLRETDADDPETSPQRWALSALALFGREASDTAPRIIDLLQDDNSTAITRLGCLEALSQIGSAAPAGIAAIWRELERGLSSEATPDDQLAALGAAEALGIIGPDAAVAVPVLLRVAQSEAAEFRREAIRSLGRIGPAARDAQPQLLDAMITDEEPVIRDLAATALGQIGPSSWPLVEPLFAADDADVRNRAVGAVASWRSIKESILPGLGPLLSDADPAVQIAACRSWRLLAGRHDRVWPVLAGLLTHAERPIRREASRELQGIAREENVTAAELDALLQSPHAAVRSEGRRLQRVVELQRGRGE